MADDLFDASSKIGDKELQEFLLIEKQKAQFNAQILISFGSLWQEVEDGRVLISKNIHEFNSVCWDKCIDKPSSKLDSKTEVCLGNCVNRFIDVSLLITKRFANMLQKSTDGLL